MRVVPVILRHVLISVGSHLSESYMLNNRWDLAGTPVQLLEIASFNKSACIPIIRCELINKKLILTTCLAN